MSTRVPPLTAAVPPLRCGGVFPPLFGFLWFCCRWEVCRGCVGSVGCGWSVLWLAVVVWWAVVVVLVPSAGLVVRSVAVPSVAVGVGVRLGVVGLVVAVSVVVSLVGSPGAVRSGAVPSGSLRALAGVRCPGGNLSFPDLLIIIPHFIPADGVPTGRGENTPLPFLHA